MALKDDFWSGVDTTGNCWIWTRAVGRGGYGSLNIGNGRSTTAHRYAYETYYLTIDPALQIDHLCKNTRCVNPFHLEMVTARENNLRSNSPSSLQARQTHCIWGHEFDETNTYVDARGRRHCRKCRKKRMIAFQAKRGFRWALKAEREAKLSTPPCEGPR